MSRPELISLDPELRYLVLLTRAGLKPLSRWEAPLDEAAIRALRRQGLFADIVERRTRFGRRLHETVFARKAGYVDLYRRRYHATRLRDTPKDARLQGQLFGYPSCCVEAFIAAPYTPNGLDPRDQAILFHWACRSCRVTPGLVREYRRANAIWGDGRVAPEGSRGRPRMWTTGAVGKVAASIALAAGTAAFATPSTNTHWTLVHDDADLDGLSVADEIMLGTSWHVSDTDSNQVGDGDQMGASLLQIIEQPPAYLNVTDCEMDGLVMCSVCGQWVNMGYVLAENSLNGLSIQMPYIALHVMTNGCMSYCYHYASGDETQSGDVDLDLLRRVLQPGRLHPHAIPARAGDSDGDGLTDDEEARLGTDPNSGADGAALAEELLALIAGLPRTPCARPHLIEHPLRGFEQCEICNGTFDMGTLEIVSPRDGFSVSMPYLALHMISHGGFAYDGTINDGEVLPILLRNVLTADGAAHWVALTGDTDGDGLLDSEEAFFGLNPSVADEDNSARPDGRELAGRMAAKISSLPKGPLPDTTHVIHHPVKGVYECLVCGELINMGFMEVVDPVAAKTVNVSYYNHHFMAHGSYSTDREDLYPRVDPTLVGDVLGITTITAVGSGGVPASFAFTNAPNPFGPEGGTRIFLTLPVAAAVEVSVFDVTGRPVRALFAGRVPDRELSLDWDGTDDAGAAVAAGVYFCRAAFGQVVVTRKLTLAR